MTLNSTIKIRGAHATRVLLLFLLTAIYSLVQAQTASSSDDHSDQHSINQAKNAQKEINYVKGISLTGKAVRLSSSINSGHEDLKPALTPCGKRLYFSRSFHPDNTGGLKDPEDIWYSDFEETTNTWSDASLLASHLNNNGPNYINNVSVTGDTIIVGNQYLKKGKMRAGLSYSVNVNGVWSEPKVINIKNDYNVSNSANAYVSIKNGVIIQAVQRAETYGQRDLYVSFWNGEETTEPINMGSVINTEFEESSPFLADDNKTLYFASKGHHGHGGYDIWVSKRLDETWTNWSEPQNLGPAVNGPLDDEFFSVTHCGNYAIFSKQVSVHNTDLFRISMEALYEQPVRNNFSESKNSNLSVASL